MVAYFYNKMSAHAEETIHYTIHNSVGQCLVLGKSIYRVIFQNLGWVVGDRFCWFFVPHLA